MSLANKYRPQSFDQMCSQSHVVEIVRRMCQSDTLSNRNFLFTGPAGTGKTSLGRLIAKSLNGSLDNVVEIDAASHSGVDDMRELVQQASQYPIGTKYKIFIIDECFPKNTKVLTDSGNKNISDITTSDKVYSMSGFHSVTHLFKNSVLTSRLCCIILEDRKIVTTVDHLFFTEDGWVYAKDLHTGDMLYAYDVYQDMSAMSEGVSGAEQSQVCEVLLDQLCNETEILKYVRRGKIFSSENSTNLPCMWHSIYHTRESDSQTSDLFKEMRIGTSFETIQTLGEYRIWDGVTETIIRKNETEQSDVKSYNYIQNDADKGSEWNSASVGRCSGWKWEVHHTTDTLIRSLKGWLGIRVSNIHKAAIGESTTYTLVLQSRPWLSSYEIGSRGRWSNPQIETGFIQRCQENSMFKRVRVERVEVYQRGSNDELFRGSFSDTELSKDYVIMYDLEIDSDHSYCADGILVHNCHALSNTSWQALLKCLEEQVAKSVFILATTNPEKIPETILSRVQSFKLSKISSDQIYDRLKYVIECENKEGRNITYTEDALRYLSNYASGGLRDALTNLDKVLAFGNNITTELLETALDLPNYDDYFELLNGIVKRDNTLITTIIDRVYNSGLNFVKWFEGYHSFLCNIVKYIFLRDISKTTIPSHYLPKIEKYTAQHAALCLKLSNKVLQMNKDIRNTQYLQEVALSYLLVPEAPKKPQGGNG